MARHREGAKDRATDGSNKKGVQLNDQGIGQQLVGMWEWDIHGFMYRFSYYLARDLAKYDHDHVPQTRRI